MAPCPACHPQGSTPRRVLATECAYRGIEDVPPPPPLTAWASAFVYEGAVRELVARLKYRNERAALPALADHVAALAALLVVEAGEGPAGNATRAGGRGSGVVVTWPPTTVERRRERGFDHAELLARRVARRLRLPARATLRRLDGTAQTGRSAAARRSGPAFALRRGVLARPLPPVVLLVDDVTTTGATLARAAATLLTTESVKSVIAATVARTPLKHGPRVPDTLSDEKSH